MSESREWDLSDTFLQLQCTMCNYLDGKTRSCNAFKQAEVSLIGMNALSMIILRCKCDMYPFSQQYFSADCNVTVAELQCVYESKIPINALFCSAYCRGRGQWVA